MAQAERESMIACARLLEGSGVNTDVTAPGATLALGLLFLKVRAGGQAAALTTDDGTQSGNQAVVRASLCTSGRPDAALRRTVCGCPTRSSRWTWCGPTT
jgi:hypothetical protein